MKRSTKLLVWSCTAALVFTGASTRAQTLDHLECYKTRDPLAISAQLTLDTAQFGLDAGCKISRAALVCVPAASTVVSGSSLPGVSGQHLQDARICYKVKCALPHAPDVELGDQFGTRVFTGLKTSLVCTPAGAEPPNSNSTTTTTQTSLPPPSSFQNIGTYGLPSNGYPTYRERAALVYLNAVRMAPLDYRAKYANDTKFSMTAVNALGAYPAVEPVRWVLGLNQASRFHSFDMLTDGCFQHSSCDGTSWITRITSFYPSGAGGENIAAGMTDPRSVVNAWLCDSTGTACCRDGHSCDGHRRNIMTERFRASGVGFASNGTKHYWTQDLAGALVPTPPATPLVDGAHMLIGSTSTRFLANYRDVGGAPRSVTLVLNGASIPMVRDLGTTTRGTFAASSARAAACRSYHFEAADYAGRRWRYPASGEFRTFGEGSCTQNWAVQ